MGLFLSLSLPLSPLIKDLYVGALSYNKLPCTHKFPKPSLHHSPPSPPTSHNFFYFVISLRNLCRQTLSQMKNKKHPGHQQ